MRVGVIEVFVNETTKYYVLLYLFKISESRQSQFLIICTFVQDHVHYNLRKYFFTNRVTCTWNSLPDSVIEASSVNSFKNRIDKHWNNFEFKYNWKTDPTGPEAVVKVF